MTKNFKKLINKNTYPWIYERGEVEINTAIEWAFGAGYHQGIIDELKRIVHKDSSESSEKETK